MKCKIPQNPAEAGKKVTGYQRKTGQAAGEDGSISSQESSLIEVYVYRMYGFGDVVVRRSGSKMRPSTYLQLLSRIN